MPKPRSASTVGPPAASVAPARMSLAVVVVLVHVAVLANLFEPFQAPKLVVLTVGAAVLAGFVGWELNRAGAVRIPCGRLVVGTAAFVALFALATLLGEQPLGSVFGDYGRSAGLLAYVAAVVVLLSVVRTHAAEDLPGLALAMLAAAVPVIGFGVLQVLGFQPLGLSSEVSDVVGTLGQPNFMAGFAGMVLPFAVWAVVRAGRDPLVAVAAAVLGFATLVVGVRTESFQALPSMAAGLGVVLVVVLLDRFGARTAGIAVAGVVALTLVVGVGAHSYVDRQVRSGMDERVLLWEAGRDMVVDRPILGSGPNGYGAEFSRHRPAVHAERYGTFASADSPHDIPLSMFVMGGLPLGLLYLAFVGATGFLLLRGLRRLTGEPRLLLAAFGGAWAAYQVQSLVSIESPVMLVGHAVTAGAIWVFAGATQVRTFTVPALAPARGGSSLVRAGTFVWAAGVILVLVALWWTTIPVRADVAYRHSLERAAGGDPNGALDAARTSVSLASWNGRYWANEAALLARGGAQEEALVAGWKAATRTPSAPAYALSAGQTAAQLGRFAAADRYFAYAADHGPGLVDVHTAWAGFLLDNGRYPRAVAQLEVADELRPDDVPILTDLATAYAGAGRSAAAAKTWRRVLTLDPANQAALEGLGEPLPAG
ncbi:MAG: hypothetical protein JWN67_2994 [Actinomycetia bacterium]|nr:hypothetical protein [Actinomycetes bacterium]